MYVILVYDIKTDNGGQKVLNRTFKICKKYLCCKCQYIFV